MRKNLKAYKQVNVNSSLLSANPHQIVLMMYDGALESMANAKGAIERNDLESKATLLTKSVNILTALQNALDAEAEPAISDNFYGLYEYCIGRLYDASSTLEISAIDEVIGLLKPIRDAWKDMPEEGKQEGFELLKQKEQQKSSEAVGV